MYASTLTQRRSASILCRSARFRVSEKELINCVNGEYGSACRSGVRVKVFRSYLKLLKVALKRFQAFVLCDTLSQRSLVNRIYSQPDCADTDSWKVNSSIS